MITDQDIDISQDNKKEKGARDVTKARSLLNRPGALLSLLGLLD